MRVFLASSASRARLKEAADARANRLEIVKALSWGQVSRRELIKWGLFTGAGALAPIPTPQGVTFMDPDDVLPGVFQRTGGSGGGA